MAFFQNHDRLDSVCWTWRQRKNIMFLIPDMDMLCNYNRFAFTFYLWDFDVQYISFWYSVFLFMVRSWVLCVGGSASIELNLKARVLEEAILSHMQSYEEKHCKSVLNSWGGCVTPGHCWYWDLLPSFCSGRFCQKFNLKMYSHMYYRNRV